MDATFTLFLNQFAGQSQPLQSAVIFFAEYFPYIVVVLFVVFVRRWGKHLPSFSSSSARGGSLPAEIGRRGALGGKEGQWRARIKLIAEGIGAAFIARGVVEVIRLFVHRTRPFVDVPSIFPLLGEPSYSFPSGHASFFFALATAVYLHNKRLGVWFFIAGAVIGFARVMAGVHYLTDILGGAVLGVFVGWGVYRLFRKYDCHSCESRNPGNRG